MNKIDSNNVKQGENGQFRERKPKRAERAYLFLAGIFLGSLVLTNLIAGKFFSIKVPFSGTLLHLSCGVIAYPVTFLVTDVISEVYGKAKADLLVKAGFFVSIFVVIVLLIAGMVPESEITYVDQATFNAVFGLTPGIVLGSMLAYLSAQFLDVRLFEFWRKLTKGKHLWLRNNGSTVLSQFVDTCMVVIIALIIYPTLDGIDETKAITWGAAWAIIVGQYIFKALVALTDTPFIYAAVAWLQRWIEVEEEK